MAASAAFALKAGVWFRRARLPIVSPGQFCPPSDRSATYRTVQIVGAGSLPRLLAARTFRKRLFWRNYLDWVRSAAFEICPTSLKAVASSILNGRVARTVLAPRVAGDRYRMSRGRSVRT